MITLDKYNGVLNRSLSEYSCLAKDVANLPTNKGDNKPNSKILNGSTAMVMDIGTVYMFSEEDDKWYEV